MSMHPPSTKLLKSASTPINTKFDSPMRSPRPSSGRLYNPPISHFNKRSEINRLPTSWDPLLLQILWRKQTGLPSLNRPPSSNLFPRYPYFHGKHTGFQRL